MCLCLKMSSSVDCEAWALPNFSCPFYEGKIRVNPFKSASFAFPLLPRRDDNGNADDTDLRGFSPRRVGQFRTFAA